MSNRKAQEQQFDEAVKKGNEEVVKSIVRSGAVQVNKLDSEGRTPLHVAIKHGHPAVADYLLRRGASITATTAPWGHTPLHWCALYNNVSCAALVLKEMNRIHEESKQRSGIRKEVLEASTVSGDTPLLLAAANDAVKVAELLLQEGANLHHCGSEGRTAAQWAAKSRKGAVLELLVSCGADVNEHPKGHKSVAEVGQKVPEMQAAINRGLELRKIKETMSPRHGAVLIKKQFSFKSQKSSGALSTSPPERGSLKSRMQRTASASSMTSILSDGSEAQPEELGPVVMETVRKLRLQSDTQLGESRVCSACSIVVASDAGDDACAVCGGPLTLVPIKES